MGRKKGVTTKNLRHPHLRKKGAGPRQKPAPKKHPLKRNPLLNQKASTNFQKVKKTATKKSQVVVTMNLQRANTNQKKLSVEVFEAQQKNERGADQICPQMKMVALLQVRNGAKNAKEKVADVRRRNYLTRKRHRFPQTIQCLKTKGPKNKRKLVSLKH